MKKTLLLIFCVIVLINLTACNSTNFIFDTMTYAGIEYNVEFYTRISDTDKPEIYNYTSLDLPIFIVDKDYKTRTDKTFYAASIEGDNNYIYLFFDGGTFLKQVYKNGQWTEACLTAKNLPTTRFCWLTRGFPAF